MALNGNKTKVCRWRGFGEIVLAGICISLFPPAWFQVVGYAEVVHAISTAEVPWMLRYSDVVEWPVRLVRLVSGYEPRFYVVPPIRSSFWLQLGSYFLIQIVSWSGSLWLIRQPIARMLRRLREIGAEAAGKGPR